MSDEDLARRAHRALEGLPPLKAPATLEARVLAAIAAHAALPWWRQSFREWPMTARLGFVLVSLLIVGLSVQRGTGASLSAAPAEWLARGDAVVAGFGGLFALAGRLIPAGWWITALGVGAVLYASLFGLGAALYRLFYLRPLPKGGMP